jgi:hypothetical protein
MDIVDQDHAKRWAAKQLKFPYVLVDGTGNIHCLKTQEDLVNVNAQKEREGLKTYIVKGSLPEKPTTEANGTT